MSSWALVGAALILALGAAPGAAQVFTPQSDKDLRLTWSAERVGPSRVLIHGDVQNGSRLPATRVILRAEGLDDGGKVVSRARGWVKYDVLPQSSSPFEIRLATAGSERQYRVTVEFFEFQEGSGTRPQSP